MKLNCSRTHKLPVTGTAPVAILGECARPAFRLRRLGEDLQLLAFSLPKNWNKFPEPECLASRPACGTGGLRSPARSDLSRAAFTMIEIALCLAIIGFALVAIIGVLPIGMSVQKDNREGTVINFDANYLMDAIRSGARGDDSLTNYIVSITNYWQDYVVASGPVTNPLGSPGVYWYLNTTNAQGAYYSSYYGLSTAPMFYNGANIIGLLSTPKYTVSPNANATFRSNYISADFRAITGSPLDQGTSQSSRDFAFVYRVFPEINPVAVADPSILGSANAVTTAAYLQNNLSDLRLSFRWPVLPNSQLGPSYKIFRTIISGAITNVDLQVPMYFLTPLSYAPSGTTNLLP